MTQNNSANSPRAIGASIPIYRMSEIERAEAFNCAVKYAKDNDIQGIAVRLGMIKENF